MNYLGQAKILAARTYTSMKPDKIDYDKVWNMLSKDTQEWALAVVKELNDFNQE